MDLPAEVVGVILTYLGKSDLLNTRSVCRSWNEESVKVLQKSRFTQQLSESRIEDFTPTPVHLKHLTNCVQFLCRMFGNESVSGLTLTTDAFTCNNQLEFTSLELIPLLDLISPGLKELDLTRFQVQAQIDTPLKFLTDSNFTFPKLTKMKCNPFNNRSIRQPRQRIIIESTVVQILIPVIQNSPNLIDLKIIHSCDLKSWPLRFDKLIRLAFDIVPDPAVILDKIRHFHQPVLQELHFLNNMGNPELSRGHDLILQNILMSVSATLKTLKVYITTTLDRGRTTTSVPFLKFPHLPYLENLELDGSMTSGLAYLNYEEINFNPWTLPSLKTVQFSIGIILTHTPTRLISPGVNWNEADFVVEFPNVNKITLRLDSNMQHYGPRTLDHFFKVFSKVSSVCIMNGRPHFYTAIGPQNYNPDPQTMVKQLLSQIIHSEWSGQINEIGLIGFDQDYLGQILTRLDHTPSVVLHNCDGESILAQGIKNVFQSIFGTMKETRRGSSVILQEEIDQHISHKMTNLKRIRLEFDSRDERMYEYEYGYGPGIIHVQSPESPPPPPPNLTSMAKHFPQLQTIEISQDLFCQKNYDLRRGQIQKFIQEFPGVVIDLI